jgi:6,7-dimethyl-8-ribityllumazine synthase
MRTNRNQILGMRVRGAAQSWRESGSAVNQLIRGQGGMAFGGPSRALAVSARLWMVLAAAIRFRHSSSVTGKKVVMNESTHASTEAADHPRFAKPQRVAFVQSSWHRDIVESCRLSFLAEIAARHIAPAQVDLFEVPGSFEIPLHVQILAKTRRYTAIVAAGLVVDSGVRGFVADTVIRALMDVQLRTEVPVFSAVVTPDEFDETDAGSDFLRKHFAARGVEVAEACANTLLSLERLRGQVAAGIV